MKKIKFDVIIENVKNFISKNDILLLIALLFCICLGDAIVSNLVVGDELWNFQNTWKLYNGGGLYTDGNAIITPLFYYLCIPIFKIFGASYIAFRIYNIFIYIVLFLMVYCLFRTLNISKLKSLLYMLIAPFMVFLSTISIGANYNILSLVFVISGLIIYINKLKNDKKRYIYEILHGINIFIIFLTKQNMLAFYIIAIVIAEFVITKNFKKSFFSLARQAVVSIILLLMFAGYLAITNELMPFINYTMLGMGEFSSNNLSFNIDFGSIQAILLYLSIIIWVATLFLISIKDEKIISKKQKDTLLLLFTVAVTTFGVIYPIGNNYHFRQAFFMTAILRIISIRYNYS